MDSDVDTAEARVKSLYQQFKTDPELAETLNEHRPVMATDDRHDEVYRTPETHLDVSMKGRYIDGYGDVLYGLRIRLSNDAGLVRVRTLLSDAGHDPTQVITDVTERHDYTEVSIEFPDILDLAEEAA